MTNGEIFKKAIEKAVENGFSCGSFNCKEGYHYSWRKCADFFIKDYESPDIYTTIFSHSFAKAFWGKKWDSDILAKQSGCSNKYKAPWRFHLQQMVLEKEPLKYIEKFL